MSGPRFLTDEQVAPTSGGLGSLGDEIGAVLSWGRERLRSYSFLVLKYELRHLFVTISLYFGVPCPNFKDKASPCTPLWLGELHYVLVLHLKQ